jgi:hypothetical protein
VPADQVARGLVVALLVELADRVAVLVGQRQHPLRRALADDVRDDDPRVHAVHLAELADVVGLVAVVELLVQAGPDLFKHFVERLAPDLDQAAGLEDELEVGEVASRRRCRRPGTGP